MSDDTTTSETSTTPDLTDAPAPAPEGAAVAAETTEAPVKIPRLRASRSADSEPAIPKIRVHQLATELGVHSRDVLGAAADLGVAARSVQSTLDAADADRVRQRLAPSTQVETPADDPTDPPQVLTEQVLAEAAAAEQEPEAPRGRRRRPAAAPALFAEPVAPGVVTPAETGQDDAPDEPAPAAPARRRRPAAAAPVAFAEPELAPAVVAAAAQLAADGAEPEPGDGDAADETEGLSEEEIAAAEEEVSSAARRRRRRGRRGRKGPREAGAEGTDEDDDETESEEGAESSDDEDEDKDDATVDGETVLPGSKRRRRRRRPGDAAGEESTADDPPGTVTKIIEPRNREQRRADKGPSSDDEVRGVTGSTRLASKRARRTDRDGRRGRGTILTESEFLARREAVDRAMLVRVRNGRTQIAVLEDDILVEHYVDQTESASFVGNIYVGKVQNVLPSMEAAFIEIGKSRNAVLYAGEVSWDSSALQGKQRRIESVMSAGQSVLVQVTKDPIGHKGARLTNQISLPGRYLVYVPDGNMTGISRKLPDVERARLKAILRSCVPESAGVIVRTAAEGASEEEIVRDVERLQELWADIGAKVAKHATGGYGKGPMLLHGEDDLVVRVVRDLFNEDFKKLVVSGEEAYATVSSYLSTMAPELLPRLEKHEGDADLFHAFRVDEQLAKALDRKVNLPSGGSLVFDRTEALTAIDINTGRFIGKGGNLEETVTRNNLEAAEEIARQLRLRDLGGMIIIDFIDMVLESNRELVLRRLIECLARDRTKHQVSEVTSLGLVQMTRKRVSTGLVEAFSEPCAHCNGLGYTIHREATAHGAVPSLAPLRSGAMPREMAQVIAASARPSAPVEQAAREDRPEREPRNEARGRNRDRNRDRNRGGGSEQQTAPATPAEATPTPARGSWANGQSTALATADDDWTAPAAAPALTPPALTPPALTPPALTPPAIGSADQDAVSAQPTEGAGRRRRRGASRPAGELAGGTAFVLPASAVTRPAGTAPAGTTSASTDGAGTTSAGTTSASTTSASTDWASTTSAGTTSASTDEAGTDEVGASVLAAAAAMADLGPTLADVDETAAEVAAAAPAPTVDGPTLADVDETGAEVRAAEGTVSADAADDRTTLADVDETAAEAAAGGALDVDLSAEAAAAAAPTGGRRRPRRVAGRPAGPTGV